MGTLHAGRCLSIMFHGVMQMFREGGWGMWPTLFLGIWAVALSMRFAMRPRSGIRALYGLGLATISSGLLGTLTGMVRTLRSVEPYPIDEQLRYIFVGSSESLVNIVLAMILVTIMAICHGIGSYRRDHPPTP